MKYFAIFIYASRQTSEEITYHHIVTSAIAESKAEVIELGIERAKENYPALDGYGQHSVFAIEFPVDLGGNNVVA